MSHTPLANKSRIGLLAVALAGGLNIASSAAFAVEALPQGYQLAAADKAAEGKCGEGKCGSSGASAKATQGEGKCGEGKCGEGKCGDASFARTDTDHDGRVSLAELLAVAPKGGEEFKAIDTNGDGYLSEAEVYKFRSNQYLSNGKKVPTELFTHMSQAKD
ncbi:EF-hand domain-containing protein [Pseudomonas tohonis]|uniref:HvfA family oxazolone/thioamide-modified RiPP metallophore n=1 Tax=Pseudomonas tohonis TaxID=2725477 RepID=UPI0022F0444F|nr:EF-hand domain-containing protein [Pseudomonas tohonis]